jgi:2,3-dihydroxybenzoate-AMP ligase
MTDVVAYPEEFAARYRAAGVWGGKTIPQELRAMARQRPDDLALATGTGQLTYRRLDERTDRLAAGLVGLGLKPGERVLLQIANDGWAVLAWYALLKAGLVPVATLPFHRKHEMADVAAQVQPAAHLIQVDFKGNDLAALAQEIGAPLVLTLHGDVDGATTFETLDGDPAVLDDIVVDPDSVAAMQLSGGTTSTPKIIPRLHAEYWFNARAYAEAIGLAPGGAVAHLLPVVHNAGIVCGVHAAHSVGACFALCAHGPDDLRSLTQKTRLTHMMIPPPIAKLILDDPEVQASLTTLTSAIWVLGALTDEIVDHFETDTCRIVQMFGMGEGLCMVTPRDAPAEIRHRAVGTTICDLDEIRVYEPGTEEPVAVGEPGELCCRGPYTIRGYFRAEERNKEAFTADGFYRTGDIVNELVHEGTSYYVLSDRIKDVINRGGEKVNAAEVEGLLMKHPAVERVALVAMPDPKFGERACAVIVPAAGAEPPTVEVLRDYLFGLDVAKFKCPERVEIRTELPLTNIDKVDKARLRREIAAAL